VNVYVSGSGLNQSQLLPELNPKKKGRGRREAE
jgi:hypothetical protein